jgi:hypothetical protein
MPLDSETAALIDEHANDEAALSAAVFGRCWPESAWSGYATFGIETGETIDAAAERNGVAWSPRWLIEAGHRPRDSAGVELSTDQQATQDGPISWEPVIRLPKVNDEISDDTEPGSDDFNRRLAGEVALAAIWRSTSFPSGIDDDVRPTAMNGNTRGARFKNAIKYFFERRLPPSWGVRSELPLAQIYGLHLRRDVGQRKSDIVVIDGEGRLIAMVSSKWSWRSDRGTEAAQMVPLHRYRPDIPYVVVTAEFPRIRILNQESVEDRVIHLCPSWAGAWAAVEAAVGQGRVPRLEWPVLSDVAAEGSRIATSIRLEGLEWLVTALATSAKID